MLTIQNEFLKTKSLHKIQQRKDRKEDVREGQKAKGCVGGERIWEVMEREKEEKGSIYQ